MTLRSFHRFGRGEHLSEHEKQRRMAVKAKGTRRIDVTLRGEMLDDYATIRRYLQGLYRLPGARNRPGVSIRISHAKIIKLALSRAAKDILEEDHYAAKAGNVRFFTD
jgi:hypothetical protein